MRELSKDQNPKKSVDIIWQILYNKTVFCKKESSKTTTDKIKRGTKLKKKIKRKKLRDVYKMKISKRKIGILFIFVIIILVESISFATYQTMLGETEKIEVERGEVILTQEEEETLKLVNEYRKQNGLEELQPLFKLQEVSKIKAKDLVENEYFSHTSEKLGTPFEMLEQNGIDYATAGENLAGNITPEKAAEAWIHSPSHKENILDEKFNYTGICVMESPIYGKVFVQLFMGVEENG